MVLKIAQALRHLHREESGFTLIELLIVIAILAVLAAIAIPLVANRIDAARASADVTNIRILQDAVELYYIDCGKYPATFQGDLIANPGDEGWNGPYIKEEVKQPTGYNPYSMDANGKVTGGKIASGT